MSVLRWVLLACLGLVCVGLAGCGGPGGAPLVSAQFPPNTLASNSEPEPLNSLPLGAANYGTAPGAVQPNTLSWTFGAR